MEEALNRELPRGIRLLSWEDITHEKVRPKIIETHYRLSLNGLEIDPDKLRKFLDSHDVPITVQRGGEEKTIDARALVTAMDFVPPDDIGLSIRHRPGPSLKPIEIVKAVLHLDDEEIKKIKILKYGQVMG